MTKPQANAYRADLAYIHDAGFGNFAREASAFVLQALGKHGKPRGLIVDLGCGSGILAQHLSRAGYDVVGFDISPDMVELARQRVPAARFWQASFLDVELPKCVAVTAVGEIFNYLFDRRNTDGQLRKVLLRIHAALEPGGLLVFDVALVGRVPEGLRRAYSEGADWACLVEAQEDPKRQTLERRITSFRQVDGHYRRDQEVHRLRLYRRAPLLAQLRQAGFRARLLKSYATPFPVGYAGFLARKG